MPISLPLYSPITQTSLQMSFSITEKGVKLLETHGPPLQLESFGPVDSFSDLQESVSHRPKCPIEIFFSFDICVSQTCKS